MQRRVVVADDDAEMLDLVALNLEHLGLIVSRADDGGDLIDILAHHGPFDLIVTDISMPWMSGLQVTQSVRNAGIATPIILITALSRGDILERSLTLDASTVVLHKPFDAVELEGAVRGLLPQDSLCTPSLG